MIKMNSMFQSAHYSKSFFEFLDIWPKGFLPFPASDLRGLAQSKATIIIENVSTKFIVFRVIQEQNCSLSLRCRPMIDILEPNAIQKIEILNDSDHPCTLSDRIYVEAIEYLNLKHIKLDCSGKLNKLDNTIFNQDSLLKYLENKQPEFFCLKCYETNVFSLIPMEEQLFRIEKRLKDIEKLLKKFKLEILVKNWTVPFLALVIAIISILLMLWINFRNDKPDSISDRLISNLNYNDTYNGSNNNNT